MSGSNKYVSANPVEQKNSLDLLTTDVVSHILTVGGLSLREAQSLAATSTQFNDLTKQWRANLVHQQDTVEQ
jgi:hypothetical protein